jgi:hypothetical protein
VAEQESVRPVKELFEAWLQGNRFTFHVLLPQAVDWRPGASIGVPFAGPRRSREQVAQRLQRFAEVVEVEESQPEEWTAFLDCAAAP